MDVGIHSSTQISRLIQQDSANASHNLRWHDSSLTSVQLYRLAGELIRDAIDDARSERSPFFKEDVLLAGYNAVPGPCIGSIGVSAPVLSPSISTAGAVSNRASDPLASSAWARSIVLSRYAGTYKGA